MERRSDDPWIKNDSEEGKIFQLIEPTSIIVLCTILFYFIISRYYTYYFGRFGIPFATLDLPFTFYIASGGLLSYYIFPILVAILYIRFIDIDSSIKGLKKTHYLALIFIPFVLITTYESIIIGMSAAIIFIFIYLIILAYKKVREIHYGKERALFSIVITMLLIFLLVLIFQTGPAEIGLRDADKLIEGHSLNPEISIYLKKGEIDEIQNKTFILILSNKANYYMVEKCDPAPENIKLYIIPEKQIDMIIGKGNLEYWSLNPFKRFVKVCVQSIFEKLSNASVSFGNGSNNTSI